VKKSKKHQKDKDKQRSSSDRKVFSIKTKERLGEKRQKKDLEVGKVQSTILKRQ